MLAVGERVELDRSAGPIVDTCGTGGDLAGTVNVSTMAAIVTAASGVRVAKHGGRAASSKCGSVDVLETLGVVVDLGPAGVARCVDRSGHRFLLPGVPPDVPRPGHASWCPPPSTSSARWPTRPAPTAAPSVCPTR
jgi:anthranilate phosphoribosyltransferase